MVTAMRRIAKRVSRPTLLALAICACVACSRTPTPSAEDSATATPAATAPAAPVIGIDLAGLDKSVQPGDDFEEYANGGWQIGRASCRERVWQYGSISVAVVSLKNKAKTNNNR